MNEAGNIIERGPSFNQSNYEKMKKIIGEKEFQNIKFQIEKLINDKEEIGEFMLKDFNIPYKKDIILGSGAGKYRLYNESIPSFLKKYSKKWNAEVYDDNIKVDPTVPMDSIGYAKDKFEKNMPVTIIEITPSMKKSVQEEGQSLFEILGIGGAGAVGAKAVSDSQGNNTISNLTQ
jgi:hypothetical protein